MKNIWTHVIVLVASCTMVSLTACNDKDEPSNSSTNSSMSPGKFSVSATQTVQFSRGNLQYQASTNTWRFATHQYEVIGADNANISPTYTGWIDLFGWGTGNEPTKTSTNYNNYSTFVDWGTNPISNDGNEANQWRTLTADEWGYLFYTRTKAATLFSFGNVNGVNGIILLPDNWVLPPGASFVASTTKGLSDKGTYYYDDNNAHFTDNTYTAEQWSVMENAGAVFLPAGGHRSGTDVLGVGSGGIYWSSIPDVIGRAFDLNFGLNGVSPQGYNARCAGQSVRLVR